jgi:hypothetical protein
VAAVLAVICEHLAEYIDTGASGDFPLPRRCGHLAANRRKDCQSRRQASDNTGQFLQRFEPQLKELGKISLSLATSTGLTVLKFIVSIVIAAALTLSAKNLTHLMNRFSGKNRPGSRHGTGQSDRLHRA